MHTVVHTGRGVAARPSRFRDDILIVSGQLTEEMLPYRPGFAHRGGRPSPPVMPAAARGFCDARHLTEVVTLLCVLDIGRRPVLRAPSWI